MTTSYPIGEFKITEPKADFGIDSSTSVDFFNKIKSLRLKFKSEEQKRDLLAAFNKVLQLNNINQEEINSKIFLPVLNPSSLIPRCGTCQTKSSIIKGKNHCNLCGRCVCNECFSDKIKVPGLGDDDKRLCLNCYNSILSLKKCDNFTNEQINLCVITTQDLFMGLRNHFY